MADDIFKNYDVYGNKLGGYSGGSSYQTQNAVPLNINTPYSQIVDDNELKPTDASRVTGARLYDAVVAMDGTGDYTDIATALNAGKKRIYIRSGIYLVGNYNIETSNVLIHGEDKNNTIIKPKTPATDNCIFQINVNTDTLVQNIVIENLTLDCNGGSDGIDIYSGSLLSGNYTSDIIIHNCIIKNSTSWAIFCEYMNYNLFIENNIFLNNTYATILIDEITSNCVIKNNYIDTSGIIADNNVIYIAFADNGVIDSNYITSDGNGWGIMVGAALDPRQGKIIVTNNIINNCRYNIYMYNADWCVVANNVCKTSQYDNIVLDNCQYTSVIGNQIQSSSQATNNTYYGIKIKARTGSGYAYGIYNTIANNIIYENEANKPLAGIAEVTATTNTDYNIISGNIIKGLTTGITTIGANTIVSDNIEQP